VQVNLAFCKLGIEDAIPDHSAFSRARNERFREGMFSVACLSVSLRHVSHQVWLAVKALPSMRA
jgi:hypothetical protein